MAKLRSIALKALSLLAAAAVLWVAHTTGVLEAAGATLQPQVRQMAETVVVALIAGYERAPAVVVGIAALAVVPSLAVTMLIARGTVRTARRFARRPADRGASRAGFASSPTAAAWIEVAGRPDDTFRLSGEMVRLGRDAENDVVLDGTGLECFHAIIRRTEDAAWMVVDVSGEGIEINGQRRATAPLDDGDRIRLGDAAVVFHRALSVDPSQATPASSLTH